ncbi:MAG TPA: PD-(D/E)XK nuclease family protein [Prolixibacteraceae bacterium]|nr:PD-(D/E)XK nuclease family protein [Prolixibacteraceae bacterium]
MKVFLKQVAKHLFEIHRDNISQLTLVFPNRRGGVFFTNYLNSMITVPLISPEIITINELFSALSPLHVPDRLSLIFRLYKVYRESTKSNELFDDFYFWGEMLISDFDQVDKYLVNARDLFTNVTDLKEIDARFDSLHEDERERLGNFWRTLSDKDKTPNQQEFIRLWEDLNGVYEKLRALLMSDGLAYEGMLYREVVEQVIKNETLSFDGKHFVFIGFNALNKCEEVLFDYLQNKGKASFFWDFDNYYLKDQTQEAGYFLRKNLVRFPHVGYIPACESLASSPKNMKIINIASQVGQAQVAGAELLTQFTGELNFDETAVVLCDEELLLPVINYLPENIEKVNVTMGYPLKMTPVFSLISQLIDLQKNARNSVGEVSFYNKDVIRVLSHQLVVDFEPLKSKEFIDLFLKNNAIYLTEKELSGNALFRQLFVAPQNIIGLSDYFLGILKTIFLHWERKNEDETERDLFSPNEKTPDENSGMYREYLYQSWLAVNRLKDILVNDGIKVFESDNFVSKEAFFRFLLQYLSGLAIPFDGEPLEGLQVMGILETRTLDFKNVILLSMNDGIMPKISSSGSFIPYNLRRVFGLPTIEEQNAMYAYYFYRLLQRAENVTFVYDSGAGGLFTGEKSRYLYQLQLESPFEISETNMVFSVENIAVQPISIAKDKNVMDRLNNYLNGKKPLSPSAIDKYLTCPLQFYFRYSAGIDEPDEISEEVDAMIFGTLFHDSMENIYKPFIDKIIDSEIITGIINNKEFVSDTITASFRTVYFKGLKDEDMVSLTGRNWLIFEVVKKYVNKLLEVDLNRAPFEIIGLEKKVETTISINELKLNVLIGGTIDRIDRKDGRLYIFDYKTGRAELSFPMLISLFDKESKTRNKAAFQTLVYSYILHKNQPAITNIHPGIYSLRGIFEEDFDPSLRSKEIGNQAVEFIAVSDQFETHFRVLLEEIFNTNIPFTQTTNEEHCKYCSYRQICRK